MGVMTMAIRDRVMPELLPGPQKVGAGGTAEYARLIAE